jgi:uncharacterized protein involved in exopolysaccharide biosynthesis
MMDTRTATIHDDDLGFQDVVRTLREGKLLIIVITVLITLAVAVAAFALPKSYRAAVVLAPVSDQYGSQMGGLGALVSQVGGLASLAGLTGLGRANESGETLGVLESNLLSRRFIEQNKLLPILFAKEWDPTAKRWRVADHRDAPDLWHATQFFRGLQRVTEEPKTGLITLTVTWKNPQQAASWANGIVSMANLYLRDKAIHESERNIAYLTAQARDTDLVGVQNAIYSIMESQIKKAMLARGTEEYALKVIDPAVPPESPYSPKPVIWIGSAFLSGLLIAGVVVLLRASPRRLGA